MQEVYVIAEGDWYRHVLNRCGVYADRKLENYRENVYRFFPF